MGQPKQLLKIGDKTLLQLAVETALNSNCAEVICILGAYINKIKPTLLSYNIRIIDNWHYEEGMSSSIKIGMEFLRKKNFTAGLIMLADQPNIHKAHLRTLINLWSAQPNKIVATTYAKTLGVPAIYPKHYFEDLKQLNGDQGAREFLLSIQNEVLGIAHPNLTDIDTLEDYDNYTKAT